MNLTHVGPYELRRELGKGAMGVVFEAWHPDLQASYALKILRPELTAETDEVRFQRELEAMAAVSQHPNVVRIHTGGADAGRLYYVMDLVDGEDLQARLNTRGRFDPRAAATVVRDVGKALAALHELGMIHRDIKPENVLVGSDGVPRLTDFGLARTFTDGGSRLTLTGELVGTPNFMAPEQALGYTDLGPAADVYALGAVLYTLIAGQAPVQGTSKMAVLSSVASGEVVPLTTIAPKTPDDLIRICMRALALAPEDRPSTSELVAALDAFLQRPDDGPTGGEVDAARKLRGLAVALGALIFLLSAVIAFVVANRTPRGAGGVSTSGSLAERADAALADAIAVLSTDVAPSAEQVARLRGVRGELATVEPLFPMRRVRATAYEGEYALRLGDEAGARASLKALAGLPTGKGRKAREAGRAYTAMLAAKVALHMGSAEEAAKASRDLDRQAQWIADGRSDVARTRVSVALLAGRQDAAEAALTDETPEVLRCQVLAAGRRWGDLEQLSESARDPRAKALAHLYLGRQALAKDPQVALAQFANAKGLTAHPLATAIAAEAHARALELDARREHIENTTKEERRQITLQIVSALIVAKTFGRAPTEDELDLVDGWFVTQVGSMTPDDLYLPLLLHPDRHTFLTNYTYWSLRRGVPTPERDLPVFRRAVKLAHLAPDDTKSALAFWQLARALQITKRVEESLEFGASMRETFPDRPKLVAPVLAQVGVVLLDAGRRDEGLAQFDAALALHPSEATALYARFMDAAGQLPAGSAPAAQLLADGRTWLKEHSDRRLFELVPLGQRLAELELVAGDPQRCLDVLDVLTTRGPELGKVVARKIAVHLEHTPEPTAAVAAALDELAESIALQRRELATFYSRQGRSTPASQALLTMLDTLLRERVPRMRRMLADGQLEALKASALDLRARLP